MTEGFRVSHLLNRILPLLNRVEDPFTHPLPIRHALRDAVGLLRDASHVTVLLVRENVPQNAGEKVLWYSSIGVVVLVLLRRASREGLVEEECSDE